MRRIPVSTFAICLFALTLAVFARVLGAQFVAWDDNLEIYRNTHLGGLTLHRIAWAFTDFDSTMRYVPLTLMSWIVTYEFCGLNPLGYHLGNLLLHGGSVVLVFLLAQRLLRAAERSFNQADRTPRNALSLSVMVCAALCALLWGFHPMRVEPVAWATTRSYCQAMFFLLASVILYVRAVDGAPPLKTRSISYWLSIVAYIMSMLSYPLGLTLPAILLLIDAYPLRRTLLSWKSLGHIVLQKVPYVLVAGAVLAAGLMARFHHSEVFSRPVTLEEFGVAPRIMQAFYLLGYFAWRPWWPVNLSPVRTDLVEFHPTDWPFVASLVAVVVISALLLAMRRRWPAALTLWTFHIIALLPVLGWTEHPHYPSDRYSLMQGLAWPLAISGGLWWLANRATPWHRYFAPAAALAMCTVMALGAMTIRQTGYWRDSISLFTHVLNVLGDDPYRTDIQTRLGMAYLDATPPDLAAAERWFADAVKSDPDNLTARILLVRLMMNQRRFSETIPLLEDGLQSTPDSIDVRMYLAKSLFERRRFAEAIDCYQWVLRRQPNLVEARLGIKAAQRAMAQPVTDTTNPR